MITKEQHMGVCEIFNEVLNELESQYRGSNFEYGSHGLVKGRGIRESEKQHLHSYRSRMNEILKSIS